MIRQDTDNFEGMVGPEAYAPARDSGGRERGHSVRDRQDQPSQRPGASHPSSDQLGSLEVLPAPIHQGAFAVPFRVPGVHLDVGRPLGDPGGIHAAACLGGQGTAASSSLLSNEVTTKGRLPNRSRQ
ncbi:hypothetical protein N7522_011290 [Penicillium canescens]|nr:hypothetical protein N7522_011290 [Penicillium canescens]